MYARLCLNCTMHKHNWIRGQNKYGTRCEQRCVRFWDWAREWNSKTFHSDIQFNSTQRKRKGLCLMHHRTIIINRFIKSLSIIFKIEHVRIYVSFIQQRLMLHNSHPCSLFVWRHRDENRWMISLVRHIFLTIYICWRIGVNQKQNNQFERNTDGERTEQNNEKSIDVRLNHTDC